MKTTLLFALIAACGLLTACKHDRKEEEPSAKIEKDKITFPSSSPETKLLLTQPAAAGGPAPLRLNGRLIWDEDATVRAFTPFGGRVKRIAAQTGQAVEKEEPLAVVSSPEYGQAQSDAIRANLDLELAQKTVKRLRELSESGAAPLKDLHAAEVDYVRCQGEAERTGRRLALYGGTTNSQDQEFVLRSPLKGVVVEKTINPGQEVRADQLTANSPPLFVITDPSRLWVLLDATEQDLASLKPGAPIQIKTQTYPNQVFAGRIESVPDFVDPGSRSIKVRASVENKDRKLKAEMFVTGETAEVAQPGVEVPASAVFLRGEKNYVFVEETGGTYQRREIRIGGEREGKLLVLDGLKLGEKVVTDGGLLLDQMLSESGT